MPEELKDLRGAKEIAIDLETNDPNLKELGVFGMKRLKD